MIIAMAGFVAMVASLQVATRPAAIRTLRVGTALSMGQIVFIITRFGNMFYLPMLGHYVDKAALTGDGATLISQMNLVILGCAAGALIAVFLVPTFTEIIAQGVHSVMHRRMLGALIHLLKTPRAWRRLVASIRPPSMLGCTLLDLKTIPKGFLFANILATSIWTVGAIAAVTVSGLHPETKQTSLLLSGLVNSFAAIAFTVLVDPQAAIILDQAVSGKRPAQHVNTVAMLLCIGNFVGSLLGLAIFNPALKLITLGTKAIGGGVSEVSSTILWLVIINALIYFLNGTDYSARVSGSRTAKVAIAITIYNFFSLIARLAGQIYAPFVGAVTDHLTHRPLGVALDQASLDKLEHFYRSLISGSTLGCFVSILLLPSFVKIFELIIAGMDCHHSLPKVLLNGFKPKNLRRLLGTLTPPWQQSVTLAALKRLPKAFLWANVIVLGFQTCGQLAAIYAGATFAPELARTTTLLSPLINGVSTIVLALIVDPTANNMIDEAVAGERPKKDIETMTFYLAMGSIAGTLIAQLVFLPAAWLISQAALVVDVAF